MSLVKVAAAVITIFSTLTVSAKVSTGAMVYPTVCSATDSTKIENLCLASIENEDAEFLLAITGAVTKVYRLVGKAGVSRSQVGHLHYNGYRSYLREIGTMSRTNQLVLNAAATGTLEEGTTVGTVIVEKNGIHLLSLQMDLRNGATAKTTGFKKR